VFNIGHYADFAISYLFGHVSDGGKGDELHDDNLDLNPRDHDHFGPVNHDHGHNHGGVGGEELPPALGTFGQKQEMGQRRRTP